jgi:hypothetical protein
MRHHPPQPQGVRPCLTPGCTRPARKRGRTCGCCATRAWRKRHRKTIAARERLRTFSAEQQAARKASAIFFTHLHRTKLDREPCAKCGRSEVVPHWPDLGQPLAVVWLCRAHRAIERERLAEEAAAFAKREAWKTLGERFETEWPRLPEGIQAQLRAAAECSPVFSLVKANPRTLLYHQQLVAAFGRYCDARERGRAPSSTG